MKRAMSRRGRGRSCQKRSPGCVGQGRSTGPPSTDKPFERDLEGVVAPTRSQAILEQDLLSRREEEADTVKQAEAQLEDLRVLEDVDKRSPLPPTTTPRGPPKLLLTASIARGLPKALLPVVPCLLQPPIQGPS